MGIFSWHKKKNKLVLAFDVGSSSVGGTLFYVSSSGIPRIILAVRELIPFQESFSVGKFLSSAMRSLEMVAGKIHKTALGRPEAIFCVLSSPWHVSQTRVIRLEKNTPFVFTSKLADDLIQKEIVLFEEEYLKKYRDAKSPVRSIEFKNIKTMLNGYETSNPINQKTKELEMTVFISISPEQVLKKMEKMIKKYFHHDEVKFSSFSLASFAVVRDIYAHNEDFLLIDIGGEMTDISMVKKNTLRESISFPLGSNFIARKVASLLHLPLGEAQSFVSLFEGGHATESVSGKIGIVMDQLKKEWLSQFQESLANLSNDISIPSTIYINVGKNEANFFAQTIENEQFNQYTLTESKFKIVFLDEKIFHGMAVLDKNIICNPNLIIDSIFICRFLIKV